MHFSRKRIFAEIAFLLLTTQFLGNFKALSLSISENYLQKELWSYYPPLDVYFNVSLRRHDTRERIASWLPNTVWFKITYYSIFNTRLFLEILILFHVDKIISFFYSTILMLCGLLFPAFQFGKSSTEKMKSCWLLVTLLHIVTNVPNLSLFRVTEENSTSFLAFDSGISIAEPEMSHTYHSPDSRVKNLADRLENFQSNFARKLNVISQVTETCTSSQVVCLTCNLEHKRVYVLTFFYTLFFVLIEHN